MNLFWKMYMHCVLESEMTEFCSTQTKVIVEAIQRKIKYHGQQMRSQNLNAQVVSRVV